MSKYKKHQPPSSETIDSAMKIAKATQKPHQTKEQTKLIAQGIQKGIAEYKKQQKNKAHELGKLKKKLTQQLQSNTTIEKTEDEHGQDKSQCKSPWLPWLLLIISWGVMAAVSIQQGLL